MYDLLHERGCGHIQIFAGGGGVFLPHEIEDLHKYGITRIYSPDDGRSMSLQGMINDMLEKCDFALDELFKVTADEILNRNINAIARLITLAENYPDKAKPILEKLSKPKPDSGYRTSDIRYQTSDIRIPILGITGTGGAGKSSLVDELVRRFLGDLSDKTIAIISVDPTKRKTGGALLGTVSE